MENVKLRVLWGDTNCRCGNRRSSDEQDGKGKKNVNSLVKSKGQKVKTEGTWNCDFINNV